MTAIAHPVRTDAATSPHPSVTALRRVGVLGPAEHAASVPRDLSRAHSVWGVTLPDASRVIVKSGVLTASEPPPETEPDISLGGELFVYRMANWCEALRAALPRALAVDEDAELLVLDDVADVGDAASLALCWGDGTVAHPAFGALGARLGAIHRSTARLPLPPARSPLILGVLRERPLDHPGPMGRLIPQLAGLPDLVEAAAEASRAGRLCLVHHDLKWDNVVLSDSASAEPVILDWELAGAGDPAWDLGCLIAEHLLRVGALDPLDSAAAALLASYARTARVSARVVEVFARRVVMAAVLRLAQLALEVAERATPGDDVRARELVALAAAHAAQANERTVEVIRCLAR